MLLGLPPEEFALPALKYLTSVRICHSSNVHGGATTMRFAQLVMEELKPCDPVTADLNQDGAINALDLQAMPDVIVSYIN